MIQVASYCRVSTDKADQANSYDAQQRFFREYIACQPDWELVDVYADSGITGTSTRKRAQFNRMMNDAYHHKFQMIITKEVSRFSRNILDTITYTRELKSLGIGVIFMSDGFSSLDPDAELRLSIMGSIAQEESRKTSSRVKWGQTRQMERGVVFGRSLLGYDVEHGKLTVNKEGAELVKLIFYKYGVEKKGTTVIARELREAGFRTYTGSPIWKESYILKLLKNEKYVGDLIQKKTITPDYLSHIKKYNHGEEDFIIHRNHHEPIISRELWNLVQEEISKRNRCDKVSNAHSNRYIFSGKIICAQCGSRFVSRTKMRKDGTSYRRWGCYKAVREGTKKVDIHGNMLGCDVGKQIRDDLAVDLLKHVLKNLDLDPNWVVQNLIRLVVSENTPRENGRRLRQQMDEIAKKKLRAIDLFLSGDLSKEEFQQMKSQYKEKLESLRKRLETLSDEPYNDNTEMEVKLRQCIESILMTKENAESFFKCILEYMMVHKDGTAEIKLNQLSTIWKFQLYKGN